MRKNIMKKLSVLFAILIMVTSVFSVTTMAVYAENTLEQESIWDYSQEPAGYKDANWSYEYEMQEYGYEKLVGAYYMGEYYLYLYDNSGIICGMADAEGNEVVKYIYDENGVVSEVLSFENGVWIPNDDDDFIGNLNKMLSAGFFYDENTDCYYIYGSYFDPVLDKYMDGVDGIDLYVTENPFYQGIGDGTSILSSAETDAAAAQWAKHCLSSNSFGKAIPEHTDSWYSKLSDVEILARAIFAEGGSKYTNEGNAVAWVILNRLNDSGFPNSAAGIVKQAGQFAPITSNKEGDTVNARIPAIETDRWANATYLACLLMTTSSKSDWTANVGTPINGQLYFYSYSYAKQCYGTADCPFSGTTSSTLKYNGKSIKNVYVLDYGNVTSFKTLFNNFSPYLNSRNIFYNLK